MVSSKDKDSTTNADEQLLRDDILENYAPPGVIGVADDDPDGYIPLEKLEEGIDVVIPRWPDYAGSGEIDTLVVRLEQDDQVPVVITNVYPGPDIPLEFIIHFGPEHLLNDGVAYVSYQTSNNEGNPAYSDPRKLTIDHTAVPVNLPKVSFPSATLWNYLNCGTVPPIWEGVDVKVPPLTNFLVGDRCVVRWEGFYSLNASGPPIAGTFKEISRLIESEDIREGFQVLIEPFDPHIKPMEDKASAEVQYTIFRGTKPVGRSLPGVVKIDRVIPDSHEYLVCGP